MDDDERTPVDTPRAQRSSVTVSATDVLLQRLAIDLSVPMLSPDELTPEQHEIAVEIVLNHVQSALDRFLKAERSVSNRIQERNRALEDKLTAAQAALIQTKSKLAAATEELARAKEDQQELFRLRAMKRTDK